MGDVVNLRTARKAQERTRHEAEAQANRAKHGRSKAERERAEAEKARLDMTVDQAKLEPPE